jgi:hypothetical protein
MRRVLAVLATTTAASIAGAATADAATGGIVTIQSNATGQTLAT